MILSNVPYGDFLMNLRVHFFFTISPSLEHSLCASSFFNIQREKKRDSFDMFLVEWLIEGKDYLLSPSGFYPRSGKIFFSSLVAL